MFSGLRSHILLITLLPSCLISLALGLYLNQVRMADLDEFIEQRGQAAARQFAVTAQLALQHNELSLLQSLANSSLEEKGLRSITVIDQNQNVLAHAGPSRRLQAPYPDHYQIVKNDEVISFSQPVSSTPVISDLLQQTLHSEPTEKKDQFLNSNNKVWVLVEFNNDNYLLKRFTSLFMQNFLLVVFFLIAGGVALRLSRNLSLDMSSLNDALNQLARGKNQPKNLSMRTQDMQLLAESFTNASSAINEEFDDMRHNVELTTSDLKQTIETIEIQNIELSLAKKSATEASKIKSEFLANTSHEIRTPLNGIIGFTKLLKRTPLTAQQDDYVETIHQSSEGLLAIINDVLDFSKIEAGKLVLDKTPFNLRQVFEDACSLFGPQAYDKGIELALMIYQDVPLQLVGDPLRIKQIVSNLLSNAIKFTPSGTIAIRVSLESETETETQISISISDTGIGMTEEQLQRLFEAFTQANTSISRQYGGTGLGLSIVRNLVSQMHGDIHADSSPNEGTTFSLNLMLEKSDKPASLASYPWDVKKVALYEPHQLVNLSTQHLLEELGCEVSAFQSLPDLEKSLEKNHLDLCIYSISANSDVEKDVSSIKNISSKIKSKLLIISPINPNIDDLCSNQANTFFCSKPLSEQRLHKSLNQIFLSQQQLSHENEDNNQVLEGLNILIADDQRANLKLLNILLSDLGANIKQAINGEEAIQQCEVQQFDIVFMDIQMPVIDGIKATETIKASSSHNQDTPIVALTANMQEDEKKRLLKTHFSEYLTKPINEKQLIDTINIFTHRNISSQIKEATNDAYDENEAIIPMLCLKLSNNKADLAIDMFSMFCEEIKASLDELNELFENNELEALSEKVHKLHGAACYTGAPTFKRLCKGFEDKLNQASEKSDELELELKSLNSEIHRILLWQENNSLESLIQA